VFKQETSMQESTQKREDLEKSAGLMSNCSTSSVPLLVQMIKDCQERDDREKTISDKQTFKTLSD